MAKRLTYEEVIELIRLYKPNLEVLGKEYTSANDRVNVRCKTCDYKWDMAWRKLYEKSSRSPCPCCSGKIVSYKNSIESNRPDLIKYLKNKEDSKNFSVGSHKIITTKCPNCGTEKEMMVTDLSRNPFSCKVCSDGISKGEKYFLAFLKQTNLKYETQKRFSWLNNRIYDFYIEDLSMIIEIMGEQHIRNSGFSKSLEYEKENDALKKDTAIENGIQNYLEINYISLDFIKLKIEIISKFKNIVDLENIDWNKCYEYCTSSGIIQAYNLYNQKLNINKVAEEMSLDRKTIRKYLKISNIIYNKEI